ncbi:hypothetical protein O1L60_38960 [Streptomyces diastatochromogenes]|nr:hypothetical protein [Streptomyces diastatochromogenes]MCZ0982887.1 hypothetical protein [Streptomyces diastatochromogenes]
MSHASALAPLSARLTEAFPARPLLVVERTDHTVGSTVLFTLCAGPVPAAPGAAAFTLCAARPRAPLPAPVSASVEGDAVAGTWI